MRGLELRPSQLAVLVAVEPGEARVDIGEELGVGDGSVTVGIGLGEHVAPHRLVLGCGNGATGEQGGAKQSGGQDLLHGTNSSMRAARAATGVPFGGRLSQGFVSWEASCRKVSRVQPKIATPCIASAIGSPAAFQMDMRWLL